MRLTEIEAEIKRRQEIDNKDPEIFNLLNKMIYLYLIRYKVANNHDDAENIALLMAEDMFMKIYNGSLIYAPIRYMAKCRNGYIRIFRKMTDPEIIDTSDDLDLCEGIVKMSTSGSSDSYRQYSEVEIKESMKTIPKIIKEEIYKSSRYSDYSSTNMNIYISVLLSINNNRIIDIFLDKSEYQYFLLILNKVKQVVIDQITKDISDDLCDKISLESFMINEK